MKAGPLKSKIAKYTEVDFPELTTRKAMVIRKHAVLRDAVGAAMRLGGWLTYVSYDRRR